MHSIVELIEKKRDGHELSDAEIRWFIAQYTDGHIPDYQAAALLMAIYFRGMNRAETVSLTMATAESGDQLDFSDLADNVIDKHSSGGIGDKTTLVVQPLVAAAGVLVGKMSGRGLGKTGGTLDKMESFTNWSSEMSVDQFRRQLGEIGLVLAGQCADLAPADGLLYALRDVTGTVASIPLIAASIMSKKLAGGAHGIVLDVKTGRGAFMKTVDEARQLARVMVDIGADAGRSCVALISDMNQPLGHAVGNALEVKEAIALLNGGGPDDFREHCLEIAARMLLLGKAARDHGQAVEMASELIEDGSALEKFRQMVVAQGGTATEVDQPELLPQAQVVESVYATKGGYIKSIDAGAIGRSCILLGAGRQFKGEEIDHAAGIVMPIKVGDAVSEGDLLGTVHGNDGPVAARVARKLVESIGWSAEPVEELPLFHGIVE